MATHRVADVTKDARRIRNIHVAIGRFATPTTSSSGKFGSDLLSATCDIIRTVCSDRLHRGQLQAEVLNRWIAERMTSGFPKLLSGGSEEVLHGRNDG